MSLYRIFLLILLGTFAPAYSMDKEPSQLDVIKLSKETSYGVVAGMCEVSMNSPLVYFKNTLQRKKQIDWKTPKVWWRGYGMNALAMGPTTAIQTGASTGLKIVMPGTDLAHEAKRAACAGSLSAALGTPVELIILDQQNYNGSAADTARKLLRQAGPKVFCRGLIPTASREALFANGYLVLFPAVKEIIKDKIDNAAVAYVGAGSITGAIFATATHPADTIKTLMQIDYQAKKYPTMRDAVRAIYRESGVTGFFSGVTPRVIRASLAIPLMGTICKKLSEKYSKE